MAGRSAHNEPSCTGLLSTSGKVIPARWLLKDAFMAAMFSSGCGTVKLSERNCVLS